MSFSKEDKKKVFDFFQDLLLKFDKPVYYEQLRGYVSNAEFVVRKYVLKECKGEKLLHYFQTRRNYFFVDFRKEVMLLNKSKCIKDTLSEADKLDAGQHATASDNISYEELTSSDYFNYSRSTSVSSRYGSEASSVDDVVVDAYTNKKSECEKETIKYFSDYLALNKKLNLHDIEIKCLPKNIRQYLTKYFKKDIALFFKKNPDTFYIDDKNSMSLVSSRKLQHGTTVVAGEEITLQDDAIISLHNFIHCAEFFFGVLKKKSLPLSYLSGYLSHASPDVSEYLNSNYATFKDFLLDADKLFVFNNDYEEVAATKDGPKLLRNANKLLHADSPISPESLKREIYCYLKSETSEKRNSLSDKDQENTCSDVKQLEISNMENLNEDNLHLVNSKSVKPEKLYISDEENINIESIDCNKLKSDDLHSAKKEKLKADKFNISNDENINVSSVGCSKTLEDKFKNEPIITNIHEENVIGVVDEELAPNVGGTFENFMDPDESDKIKSITQRNFIECVFTMQLLCLEMVEKQLILCYKYEYDAVKYFVEVLEKLPLEMNDVTSLKGTLGQASEEVNFFMKTLYKGDKISLFFEKHDEFDLTLTNNSKILRLSPSYKCDLEDKRKVHKLYVAGTKVYDVYKLYNLQLHDMFMDVLDCLTKICRFLQNKPRIKLTRLNSVFSKFSPTQKNFINSLIGGTIHEKLERFLCYFSIIFHVTEEFIELNLEQLDITLFLNSLIEFTQKLNKLSTYDEAKLVYSDYLLDYLKACENDYSVMSFDEMKVHVVESVQNFLSCLPDFEYSYLPDVVGYVVLHNLVLEKKDSQFLIQLLEESNLFSLHDGEISHRQENNKEIDFISDSNSSDKISSEDSRSEKSESPVIENENKLHENKEQISNDDDQKDTLSNIPPSFCKNDEHVRVDEVCHEDLEISAPKRHSFIEDDVCVDSEESKAFNKNLMNEDSGVVSFNKNKSSDQPQDEQNDLNYENNFRNKLISSASAQNDARNDREINIQDECKQSDVPSSEEAVLNLKTDSNISCATIFNKQEVEIVSESLCIDDKAAKLVKSSINESNKETVSENTDSTIKQKNPSSIDEINLSVSTEKFSKPSLLNNSTVVNYSKVWESLCKSSISLEKENNASEICEEQISSNTNDVNLNCIENISSTKNTESLSRTSTSAMSFKDKQFQNSSHCDHKNYIRNANLAENSSSSTSDNIKSHPTLNFESSHPNNKTDLNKTSKTGNKSVTSPTFSGSPVSKSDSNESDSESDKPRHNFDSTFLQPLQAKIIILTLDSCIAETVVNSQKKCIFCLKSCFRCDLHSDCSDCFNSLFVGDEILCYIPPTEDLNCGNMCFAFMFHKDLGKNDGATTSHGGNIHNEYLQRNSGKDKFCSSLVEESQVQYSVISQSAQVPPSIPSQSTQVPSSVESQITQTIESSFKKCHKIEKECQVKCTSVSQITQTANVTSEADCQTVLTGEVKSCVSVSEKACLTRFPTFSQNTQTICETIDHSSQTNVSGDILPKCDTSSCECQTILTGQVRKCESVTDKCCQTLFSRQVAKTTQTETENDAEMTVQRGAVLKNGSFDNIPCDANTGARSKRSFLVAQKEFCDTSCQTRSTGAIYLMAIYHDEE